MNTIPLTQNEPGQIERLAAQRQLYSDAKRHQSILIIATIASVIAAFITPFWAKLQPWAAAVGLLIACYEGIFAGPAQNKLRERAARTQELFDCEVLKLPWLEHMAGRKPAPEEVRESYTKYLKTEPELKSLFDWYPVEVAPLPLYLARFICQRSSCRWDGNIRRKFADGFLAVTLLTVIAAVVVGLWKNMSFEGLLLGVAVPLVPAVSLGIKQYKEQQSAADTIDKLREHLETAWETALGIGAHEEEALTVSRGLQSEIFHHRSKSPLVFDWVYRRLRDVNEEQMNVGAREYIEQARKHLHLPPTATPGQGA